MGCIYTYMARGELDTKCGLAADWNSTDYKHVTVWEIVMNTQGGRGSKYD